MSQIRIVSALFAAAVTLAACDRPTVVAVPPAPAPSPSTIPVPVPGPAGPAGPQGNPGSSGSNTTVVVTPPASAASR